MSIAFSYTTKPHAISASEHLGSPPLAAAVPQLAGELVVLSAAGTRAPVAWRERLAVHADEGAAAAQLPGAGTIAEAIVLSTCERFDVYAVASDAERAERELVRWVAERSGSPAPAVANRVRTFHGRAAARHVIATAAGLHSAVLGEHEILGQVRRARDRAARAGATGPVLDRLAVDALRAGRRARATTSLGRGSLSVLSVGLELIADLCPGTGRRALVVGSSRTASAACERLRALGWAVAPAADLSARSPLGTSLHEFHALVTCTGTSGKVVSADALADAAGQRGGTPLVVLDLSVPRDVDPRARYVEGVLLFDVDALPVVAEPALASRRAGVADAKRIVDEELDRFDAWRADQLLAPTIKALRDHVRGVLEDALAEADERTVERIVGRILHTPTRRLREARADARGPASVQLLRWLFGVDGDPGGSVAARP